MDGTLSTEQLRRVPMEQVIRTIRETRDRQIDELMKEPGLFDFLERNFSSFSISQLKIAFLKKDLAELKKSSLDLSYYSALIKFTKESNIQPRENHSLFVQELMMLFRKYVC